MLKNIDSEINIKFLVLQEVLVLAFTVLDICFAASVFSSRVSERLII
jgi:hypothetical protein